MHYLFKMRQTAVHELGHALGMNHDINDDSSYRTYIDKFTNEEEDCSGFMDSALEDPNTGEITNHPSLWSECSVNDFRKAYREKKWGTNCFKGILIGLAKIYFKISRNLIVLILWVSG